MSDTSAKKFSIKAEPVVIAESAPLLKVEPVAAPANGRYVSPGTLLEQKIGAERLKKHA